MRLFGSIPGLAGTGSAGRVVRVGGYGSGCRRAVRRRSRRRGGAGRGSCSWVVLVAGVAQGVLLDAAADVVDDRGSVPDDVGGVQVFVFEQKTAYDVTG